MKRQKIEKILHAEKIAAGEVVERPANVMKELVENSIDAGAKEIRVFAKNSGKTIVQVIDDGIGIPPDEIEIAFERYSSSKIRSIEDLDHLSTLGFRGRHWLALQQLVKLKLFLESKKTNAGYN